MRNEDLIRLIQKLPRAFPADPAGAFRDFLRVQERLRGDGDPDGARALADALWVLAPEIPFASDEIRAAFFRQLAHFFAAQGPAQDAERAAEALEVPRLVAERRRKGGA